MPKLAVLSTSKEERQDLLVAPPGSAVEIVRYGMRFPGFASTPYDHLLVALGHIDAAERAAADGCDAMFIDTFGDYGIGEMRFAVEQPVIGAAEAAIAAGSANGTRDFSIVTVWPESMHFLYEERLDNSPGGERCRRVEHVFGEDELKKAGTDAFVKARMARQEIDVVEVLAACVQRVADEDGVDAIVLGCTCMAPVGPQIQERVDVEVIEPTRHGLAVALEAIASVAPGGPGTSSRRGTVPAIVDAWLEHGPPPQPEADECSVCVVVASSA